MDLKQLRESRGLSRKEVSQLSGINLRSLQDYEQGHKEIASAKGETLYRLSLVLGCTIEEILDLQIVEIQSVEKEDQKRLRRLLSYSIDLSISKREIQCSQIYSPQYKIYGKWKLEKNHCNLMFLYGGIIVQLPFNVAFSAKTLPWLTEAAIMMIENYVETVTLNENFPGLGGDEWDE